MTSLDEMPYTSIRAACTHELGFRGRGPNRFFGRSAASPRLRASLGRVVWAERPPVVQDCVDADQQFPGHGDRRFPVPLILGEAQVRCLQEAGASDHSQCRLDEDPAQVAVALAGDPAAMSGPGTLVDSRGQPRIADQVLGTGEAGDVADIGEDQERREDPDPWDRGEPCHLGVGLGQLAEFPVDPRDLLGQERQPIVPWWERV